MLFDDHYTTIKNNATSEFKDRGSKFYGFALKTTNKKEFNEWLQKSKSKFPDATHHCYAYVLHPDRSEQYDTDDGEPSNSAGKPILRAINSFQATQIAVIVVRYYGGVNLGIPGLINAYGEAAKLAIEKAMPVKKDIEEIYEAHCPFGQESQWYGLINNVIIKILAQKTEANGYWARFSIPKAKSRELKGLLNQLFSITVTFKHFL